MYISFFIVTDSLRVFPGKPTVSQSTAAIQNTSPQSKPNNIETQTDEDDLNLFKKKINKVDIKNENIKPQQKAGDTNLLDQKEAGTDTDNNNSKVNIPTVTVNEDNDKYSTDKEMDMKTSNDSGISDYTETSIAPEKSIKNTNPTSKPSPLISSSDSSIMSSSISNTDENSELDAPKQSEISVTSDTNNDGSREDDDETKEENMENSRITNIPTSSSTKPSISQSGHKEEERVRKEDNDKISKVDDEPQRLPTSAPSKKHGLGLQESLGMLEPTESGLKVMTINYAGFALLWNSWKTPGILKISSRALENSLKIFF
jgi:hypothetical protein